MIKLIPSPSSIGLEQTLKGIKCATIATGNKHRPPLNLFTLQLTKEDVKQLYIHHPVITTALEGKEVLIRPLRLQLLKDKDIKEALPFQVEPLLPYPADEAYLAYQIVAKNNDSTDITLLAARKEAVISHIDHWKTLNIEPEKIACVPLALCSFSSTYLSNEKTFLILHVDQQELTCSLIKEGKLLASFSHSEGFNCLIEALAKEGKNSFPQNESEWEEIEKQENSPLMEALKRQEKQVTKMGFSLAKECKNDSIEGVIITGEAVQWSGLGERLVSHLNLPLLTCQPTEKNTTQDLCSYAVPIGLALSSSPSSSEGIDFRQADLAYPHPWRRLKIPMITYFLVIIFLACSFSFLGFEILRNQENEIKQTYLDLLKNLNRSYEDFEAAFYSKNPHAYDSFDGKTPKIGQLKQEDFSQRLIFLQKELQATPDSFPLFANIPRVSDVLAWLGQLPTVVSIDEQGNKHPKLQIENFNYIMLKRPESGKKQEKYQVKVELEFSSPTPKWAREFHDALIAPNNWIDPKGEVKWNSNRGKYKTSFFLKDKTTYPSS